MDKVSNLKLLFKITVTAASWSKISRMFCGWQDGQWVRYLLPGRVTWVHPQDSQKLSSAVRACVHACVWSSKPPSWPSLYFWFFFTPPFPLRIDWLTEAKSCLVSPADLLSSVFLATFQALFWIFRFAFTRMADTFTGKVSPCDSEPFSGLRVLGVSAPASVHPILSKEVVDHASLRDYCFYWCEPLHAGETLGNIILPDTSLI